MIIQQTNLNLVYPRITEYRKKFANSEDILERYFMPSTVLPIPEQVQDEVPRIIAQTKNGHSMLNIALSVASFTTNYNGEFVSDWNKCKEYLEQRCSDIYKIIDEIDEIEIFGVSPFGDKSLLEKLGNINKVIIYVYNSDYKDIVEWKKYIPNAIFKDSSDFLK